MHSFHPSRGRILFETLCALAAAASLALAWTQTGASALLGAAGAAALYGLVRLSDARQPKPAEAAEPQRIDSEPEIAVPVDAIEVPEVEPVAEVAEAVQPATVRSGAGRRTGSRKGSGRRAKTEKKKSVAAAPVEETDVPWPMVKDPSLAENAPAAVEEFSFTQDGDGSHPHIAPLFEPEPFARMPRRAFGRRGQL